jgi:hypothetical protein
MGNFMWRLQQGVKRKWRDDVSCANFVKRGELDRYHRSAMLARCSTILLFVISVAHRPVKKQPLPIANSFIENKNPQTLPEASLLVPTELGEGIGSLLEQDSKPNRQVVLFTSLCKCTLLAAGWYRGLWFQSTFALHLSHGT